MILHPAYTALLISAREKTSCTAWRRHRLSLPSPKVNRTHPTLGCFDPHSCSTPRLSCLSAVTQCLMEGHTRGLATIPRLALDVMACEVLRVLQLTDTFLVPVSYIVPRKVSACGAIRQSLSSKLGPCDHTSSCPAAFPVTHHSMQGKGAPNVLRFFLPLASFP